MNYWIVQCNPDTFDLLSYLRSHSDKPDRWTVSVPQYERQTEVGDMVFVWKAKGSEDTRGIYAKGEVTARPGENAGFPDYGAPYWKKHKAAEEQKRRLKGLPWMDVRYRKTFLDNPLLDSNPVARRELQGLLILRMPRRGIYKLTTEQAKTIQALLGEL